MNLLSFLLNTFILLSTLFSSTVSSWQDDASSDELFDRFISAGNHTLSRALDGSRGGNGLHIKVGLILTKLVFTEPNQATLNLMLVQQWHDSRLKFRSNIKAPEHSTLRLSAKTSQRIWLPSTYFAHALNQSLNQEDAAAKDKTTISPAGDLCYSQSLTVKVACSTGFTFYPVDQQHCTLHLKSKQFTSLIHYNITANKLGVWSADSAIASTPDMKLLGFNRKLDNRIDNHNSFNTLEVVLSRRPFFYYLVRYYLPPLLVVIAAFFPLYLAPTVHYKLISGLGSTAIMSILVAGFYPELPNIHMLTALDVYLFFCLFSVFLAVVEYSIIGYFDLVKKQQTNRKNVGGGGGGELVASDGEDGHHLGGGGKTGGKKLHVVGRKKNWKVRLARTVHFAVGILYPVFFVFFHLLYSVVLLGVVIKQKYDVEIRHPTSALLNDVC